MRTIEQTTFKISCEVDGPERSYKEIRTTDLSEAVAEFKGFADDFIKKGFTIETEGSERIVLTDGKEDDGTTVYVGWKEETEYVDAAEAFDWETDD